MQRTGPASARPPFRPRLRPWLLVAVLAGGTGPAHAQSARADILTAVVQRIALTNYGRRCARLLAARNVKLRPDELLAEKKALYTRGGKVEVQGADENSNYLVATLPDGVEIAVVDKAQYKGATTFVVCKIDKTW